MYLLLCHPRAWHFDGFVQERHNSIANSLKLCLSCTNPSIYTIAWQLRASKTLRQVDFFGATFSKVSMIYFKICQYLSVEHVKNWGYVDSVEPWNSICMAVRLVETLCQSQGLRLTIVTHVHHQYIFTGGLTTSSDQNLKTDGHHFAFCWTWPLCNHASLFFCVTS